MTNEKTETEIFVELDWQSHVYIANRVQISVKTIELLLQMYLSFPPRKFCPFYIE